MAVPEIADADEPPPTVRPLNSSAGIVWPVPEKVTLLVPLPRVKVKLFVLNDPLTHNEPTVLGLMSIAPPAVSEVTLPTTNAWSLPDAKTMLPVFAPSSRNSAAYVSPAVLSNVQELMICSDWLAVGTVPPLHFVASLKLPGPVNTLSGVKVTV